MSDFDTTGSYDPSPEMKYLLGRAIFPSAGASAGINNPKIVAAEGRGPYGTIANPKVEDGAIMTVHFKLDPAIVLWTKTNAVSPEYCVTEQGITAVSQNAGQATTPGIKLKESEVRKRITKKSVNAANSPQSAYIVANWARRLKRVQEFRWYMERITVRGLISQATEREALLVWESLSSATSSAIGVPNAAPGNDGQLLLVWDSGQHHLEIEFQSGATPSLFYADRTAAGSSWELDIRHDAPLSLVVLRTLALFSEPTNA
jgi:hypothetical protein